MTALAAVVVLLALALAAALGSQTVARYLVHRGAEAVPGLSLQFRGGTLWGGIDAAALRYQGGGVAVTADRLTLRWSLACLAGGRLCLDRIALAGVTIDLTPAAPTADAGPPASMPVLPVELLFREIAVDGLRLTAPGTELSLAAGRIRASLGNAGLDIAEAQLTEPRIRLTGEANGEAPDGAAEALPLPPIATPLPVNVRQLDIRRPALETATQRYQARSVTLSGRMAGHRLTLVRLRLAHEQGEAELSGSLGMSGDYPVDLRLTASVRELYQGQPLRASAELAGSVADLAVRARLGGLVQARLDGRLQPLQPTLPYTLTVRSQLIGWPLSARAQQVTAEALRLQIRGDRAGYSVTGGGDLIGTQVPPLAWRIQARGDWRQTAIEALELEGLGGRVRISGELAWSPQLRWQAEVSAEGVEPDRRWPEAPRRISGNARVSGSVADGEWRLRVVSPGLDLVYRGQALGVSGRFKRLPGGAWQAEALELRNGANRVRAEGRLNGGLELTARLDLPEPQRWVEGLAGTLQGTVTASGSLSAPSLGLDLTARSVTYAGAHVAEARLEGEVTALGTAASRLTLHAADATYDGRRMDNLRLVLDGERQSHTLTVRASGEGAAAELQLEGGLGEAGRWQGRLADGAFAWEERRWRLAAPAKLAVDPAAAEARLGSHCWTRGQTRLCLTRPARLGQAGSVALAFTDMPLGWLGQWLPAGFTWRGRLDGDLQAEWSPQQPPRLQADLVSEDGVLGLDAEDTDGAPEATLPLGYRQLKVVANLDEQRLQAEVTLESDSLGTGRLRLGLRHADPGRPVQGELRLEGVELAAVQPLFPRIETLNGRLAVTGRLGGRLQSPTFDGELRLRGGEIQGPQLPMSVEDLTATLSIAGRRASIEGAFRSGGGQARITGDGRWTADSWRLEARLNGERLRVRYPPVAVVAVSPDLRLQADAESVALTGTIRVPEGDLTLRQLPKGAVPYSTDVVVVRGPGARSPATSGNGLKLNTRIEVVLGEAVRFSGLGAEGRLTGALRLRQVGASGAEATGEIRIVDANFEAYGQRLEIRSGRLIFAGPVTEPLVEIEAIRTVDNVVAGLRVDGPASQPEISLFSEPPMPEEQILAYLVTGRAYGEPGPEQDAAMAQAAVALGVFTGRGAASDIAAELGVEDFQLAAEGEGETTQVTLSGYIAPNLLVKYGVGVFTPHNTLILRYEVTRNIYLEAVSGLESAIDAFYTVSF